MNYTVTLQPSGASFVVTEDDVILDAALEAGIRMPHGCRAGTCRSCKARVLEGEVDVGRAFPAPAFLRRLRQADGFTLMCRATASSDVVIEVNEALALAEPRQVATGLISIERLAPDVAHVRIAIKNEAPLPFQAGQFVEFILPDGKRRSYSIANPPQDGGSATLEFHIRHMPRGAFTDVLFSRLPAGHIVGIEGPFGDFYLRKSDKPALLLASGTGYAPIRAILLDAIARGERRPMTLYWGARSRRDLYLLEEVHAMAAAHDWLSVTPVLSEPAPGDGWTGRTGLVHAAAMADIPDMAGWEVYACGIPAMVDAARQDFIARCGMPVGSFFADAFVSEADLSLASHPSQTGLPAAVG